jgi:undecaprenyl-diphosphatase
LSPESGRIFVNTTAGPQTVDVEDLTKRFSSDELEVCEPDELTGRIETEVRERSAGFIGIAGGDGTVRCAVATVVAEGTTMPLLVVPAGTRNHFATDLGMPAIDDAVEAADRRTERAVDVASVNGEVFVNNSSIGLYPNLVAEREEHENRLGKRLANVVAAWRQLREGHHLAVEVDGRRRTVWAVFVGNNCYGDSIRDLVGRENLDDGVLDIRIARAEGRWSRLRIVFAVLFGRLERSPLIERLQQGSVVIETHEPVDVALDGEVVELSPRLEYRSMPRALRVLVPHEGQASH